MVLETSGKFSCLQLPGKGLDYNEALKLKVSQQEHNMKAKNGGNGMTDEQVRHFINRWVHCPVWSVKFYWYNIDDRYMPSYELFQDGIDKETSSWSGKGLRFIVNIQREIVGTESFWKSYMQFIQMYYSVL